MSLRRRSNRGRPCRWDFLFKILFTALTLGAGYKGGEVVPSFFVGATFGCVAAPLLGLPAGFGAALGLAAVFCGATNCLVPSIVLAVELFGAPGLLYYAIACGISYALSGYTGLYSHQTFLTDKLMPEYRAEIHPHHAPRTAARRDRGEQGTPGAVSARQKAKGLQKLLAAAKPLSRRPGKEKSRKPFHDFLLGGAAGGRLVFSFESSGQGGPMSILFFIVLLLRFEPVRCNQQSLPLNKCFYHCSYFGIFLFFWKLFCFIIQECHHSFMFEIQSLIINSTSQMENSCVVHKSVGKLFAYGLSYVMYIFFVGYIS